MTFLRLHSISKGCLWFIDTLFFRTEPKWIGPDRTGLDCLVSHGGSTLYCDRGIGIRIRIRIHVCSRCCRGAMFDATVTGSSTRSSSAAAAAHHHGCQAFLESRKQFPQDGPLVHQSLRWIVNVGQREFGDPEPVLELLGIFLCDRHRKKANGGFVRCAANSSSCGRRGLLRVFPWQGRFARGKPRG